MTARNASSESPPRPVVRGPVGAILTIALLAGLLLVVAEFTTIASVHVEDESCQVLYDTDPALADRCSLSGFERHGGALILLALLAVGAGLAARRGTTTAIGAVLVAIGVVVLGLTLIVDLPVTDDVGAVGNDFDSATASAGLGFYLELAGGVLCLGAGVLGLIVARRARQAA